MRNSLKATLAAVGIAGPLVLGMAYTAGASVGELAGSNSHNVDQWIMNEDGSGDFVLDREEIDGEVTLVVTGPDGAVLEADEFPDFIEEAVAEFGATDWVPPEADLFTFVDGVPCYLGGVLDEVLVGSEGPYTTVSSGDDGTFVIDRLVSGHIDSAYFPDEISGEQLESDRDGGLYSDIQGAENLNPCP